VASGNTRIILDDIVYVPLTYITVLGLVCLVLCTINVLARKTCQITIAVLVVVWVVLVLTMCT